MVRWQSDNALDCKPGLGRFNSYPDLHNAQMAELVDAPVLEAGIERCASSSLALGTIC